MYIVDSGNGASNIIRYLSQMKSKIKANPYILDEHLGDKTNAEIKKIFRRNQVPERSFIGCNTLNSVFPSYLGSYNLLLEYLKSSNAFDLVLCTNRTKKNLKRDIERDNWDVISLNVNYVELIDDDLTPELDVDDSGVDNIINACTHYDNLNILTNKRIISTSKMSAIHINKKMR